MKKQNNKKFSQKIFDDLYLIEKGARDLYDEFLESLEDDEARKIIEGIKKDEEEHMKIVEKIKKIIK